MEKELGGDEVIVEILGAEKSSNSSDLNAESDIEKQKSESTEKIKVGTTASLSENPKVTPPETPKEHDDHNFTKTLQANRTIKRRKKIKLLFVIEFSLFVCIALVLILSKTTNKLEKKEIWKLELWKWCVLALAIFCGRMFSKWLMDVVVFLLKKRVLYFVYGVQKNVRVFIWLGLVLLAWVLLINRGVHRSRDTAKILDYITRGIASTFVVAGAWIFKTLLEKKSASSFNIKRFYDNIHENIFKQYIIETLSGPPLMEGEEQNRENVIGMQKIQKIEPAMTSALTMTRLIEVVTKPVFSNEHDESVDVVEQYVRKDEYFRSELESIAVGDAIFENVAKHGHKYIEEDDLLRFMHKDEVKSVLIRIGGEGRIKKKTLTNWVVNVYKESRSLAVSINSTNRAIAQLNKFITGFMVAVLIILWIILMGIATTEVLLFISSQFLLAVFSFGATALSALEAMIFVFLKHPFDVGDRCVVDGVQVVVEEVSILTTVFLRYDNEKIYYPNSVLATKIISNFNRSPDMGECVEFDLDVSTSVEKISALKAKIEMYINSKPALWSPEHIVRVREIEDANKLKMDLWVQHTINFQDYDEKSDRRSKLVLELKKIFEEIGVKYHILPPKDSH